MTKHPLFIYKGYIFIPEKELSKIDGDIIIFIGFDGDDEQKIFKKL